MEDNLDPYPGSKHGKWGINDIIYGIVLSLPGYDDNDNDNDTDNDNDDNDNDLMWHRA